MANGYEVRIGEPTKSKDSKRLMPFVMIFREEQEQESIHGLKPCPMGEDLKTKVIDIIDSLIPKGQNSLDLETAAMAYGITRAKEAVEKLFAESSTQTNDSNALNALDTISRQTTFEVLTEYYHHKTEMQHKALREALDMVPSEDIDLSDYSDRLWRNAYEQGKADAEVERKTWRWNDHEVACIIADLMGDACACNHNGIDEWLPKFCDFANTDACPHPVGVACWEQYLKWKGETDE